MPGSRFVLTTRAGGAVRNPIDGDLRRALDDVFGRSPLAANAPPPEPASAWLLYELDTGERLVLEVCHDGTVIFDQWADADYKRELSPTTRLLGVSFSHALALWRALRAGDVSAVRAEGWEADAND